VLINWSIQDAVRGPLIPTDGLASFAILIGVDYRSRKLFKQLDLEGVLVLFANPQFGLYSKP
jgi:hypothetical protein